MCDTEMLKENDKTSRLKLSAPFIKDFIVTWKQSSSKKKKKKQEF